MGFSMTFQICDPTPRGCLVRVPSDSSRACGNEAPRGVPAEQVGGCSVPAPDCAVAGTGSNERGGCAEEQQRPCVGGILQFENPAASWLRQSHAESPAKYFASDLLGPFSTSTMHLPGTARSWSPRLPQAVFLLDGRLHDSGKPPSDEEKGETRQPARKSPFLLRF
jgi:hypothetical protein